MASNLPVSPPAPASSLLRGGYTILHLGDLKESWPDWEGKSPLPKMEEVRTGAGRFGAGCVMQAGVCPGQLTAECTAVQGVLEKGRGGGGEALVAIPWVGPACLRSQAQVA